MLTPKARSVEIAASVAEARLMQTSSDGGSSDSELTEVAVSPQRPSPRPAEMMLTPPARSRMANLNRSGLGSSTRARGAFNSALIRQALFLARGEVGQPVRHQRDARPQLAPNEARAQDRVDRETIEPAR